MAKETTLNLKLRVQDDGSVVLDKFGKSIQKVKEDVDKMSGALSLIKWDALVNLGERAFRAGQQIYDLARSTASFGSEMSRLSATWGMSIREFQEWRAFDLIEPIGDGRGDVQAAVVAWTVAQAMTGARAPKFTEFILDWE